MVERTLDRSRLWAAQTPQVFRYDHLLRAHREVTAEVTDDAAMLEALGLPVKLFEGSATNIKVTTPEDLRLAEALLEAGAASVKGNASPERIDMRIGIGYDIHRFQEGRPLVLGGVKLPGETGLGGHSDADVLLHAVIDALLGAAGLGDIGQRYPPDDPAYAGADSRRLL